jgi:quinol-cytochrome oxidoreductase complex cytochrome b subunit
MIFRNMTFIVILLVVLGGLLFNSQDVDASIAEQGEAIPLAPATPTIQTNRRGPPPTVYPPAQADNGSQAYWGMCDDCHGDQGQGLTEKWQNSFAPEFRDCWKAGCHNVDHPENSFEIPQTGAPALSGQGTLAQFSNAFELQTYILENMPYFPPGSLTSEQAWSLTAHVMQLKERQLADLTLNEVTSAAIPVHFDVHLPENEVPGILILSGVLLLAGLTIRLGSRRLRRGVKASAQRPNFFHHLHPPSIPADQSRFRYTLGSGGLAVFLSLILLLTGLLEMYYYIPTSDQAAISVQTLTTLVPFGNLVRNLHYWSAQFLVIVMTVHLLRVVLTGAYAPPRRFNYLLGLGLLILILLLDFTGYALRWDEGIRWALIVGTNLLKTIPGIGESLYRFVIGGSEPNASTVTRFFGWHVFGLTVTAGVLMIWHAFRVRRDGGIASPPSTQSQKKLRITRFELVRRELLGMLVAGVVLLVFSLAVGAPIEQPLTNSGTLTGDSGAPWFFLWIQQLLRLGDPFLWGVLTPLAVVVVLALLPYVLPNVKNEELGRWLPNGNRIAQVLAVSIIFLILILTVWGAPAK